MSKKISLKLLFVGIMIAGIALYSKLVQVRAQEIEEKREREAWALLREELINSATTSRSSR